MKDKKIIEGEWSENISWEFYLSASLPPCELCTAVFCVGVYQNQIMLTKTKRGWELPGGHIESGETIEQAMKRECKEEGGMEIEKFKLFGYRKIIAKCPIEIRDKKECYPFPVSYMPYYIGTTNISPEKFTGQEVIDNQLFSLDELDHLRTTQLTVIRAGFEELQCLE
ncbi:MAG: NUDIX domain-containing protein [Candidatus Moranbacteria bacterium]|nr:NUDIX domain-containing protein [Candidatus Moranbacteria bacterium]